MSILTKEQWQDRIGQTGDASLLQSAAWGELKSHFGWKPSYVGTQTAGAMVLFRKLPLGLTIAYIPRGPIGYDFSDLWSEIHALCRSNHAVFLRVEPGFWQDEPRAQELIQSMRGFRGAFATVQPPRTILIPLRGNEDDWLARMNQKTRYNIRLSQKKDLIVEETWDAAAFHQLMRLTGERDAFGVHSERYYQTCLDCFRPLNQVRILQVSYRDQILAAIMLFIQGKRGYYLYGASSNLERNRMPNYLLQWRAMQICKEEGCVEYDLWGVPDEDESVLEADFQNRHDGLWQVYRFKRGFGGELKRTSGSYDYVYLTPFYQALKACDRVRRKRASG